jgi:predicted ATP-dependent serine protease
MGFSPPDLTVFIREQKSFNAIGTFLNERADISGQEQRERVRFAISNARRAARARQNFCSRGRRTWPSAGCCHTCRYRWNLSRDSQQFRNISRPKSRPLHSRQDSDRRERQQPMSTTTLPFPMSLSEKYRPRTIAAFVGLDKPKRILSKLAANPYASAWLFAGPPGVGKTTMALALAETLHHIVATMQCR